MTNKLSSHWIKVAQELAHTDEPIDFTPAQINALKLLEINAPEIYSGKTSLSMSDDDILAISQKCNKGHDDEKIEIANFIAKGIGWGNHHLNFDIPLPPSYHQVNRSKNHLQPKTYKKRSTASKLVDCFYQNLEKPIPTDPTEQLGQILLSAVLFGGLLSIKWYQPFIDALTSKSYYQVKSWLWLDMSISKPNKNPHPGHKRWVADYLTQLLIYRYLRHGGLPETTPIAWKAAHSYLTSIQADIPNSLTKLRDIGMSRHLYSIHPSIFGYATGDLPSTSMPINAWLRIMTGKTIITNLEPLTNDADNKINTPEISDAETTVARQIKLLKEIKKIISPLDDGKMITIRKGKAQLKKALKVHKAELAPALQLLILWSIQLLSQKVLGLELRKSSPLKVSSVRRYWSAISGVLIRTLELENPTLMDPQTLANCYEEMIEKLNNTPYAIKRLKQFHGYLVAFHRTTKMEFNNLMDGEGQVVSNVDANLICPTSYEKIILSLGWGQDNQTRWQKLYIIATILAYRCGLRSGEIRALETKDIQGITQFEALIRKKEGAWSPKSDAGTRRDPLSALSPQNELDFMLEDLKVRKSESNFYSDNYWLAHPERKSGMLSDKELIAPIRQIIRKVTRDQSLQFHHLRHSFLTWTNCALLLDNKISPTGCCAIEHSQFKQKKRQELAIALTGNECSWQKQQYILAMITGHNSPKTSHKNYDHFSDWLLGYHCRSYEHSVQPSHKMIMALTGLSRAQAFTLTQQDKAHKVHPLHSVTQNQSVAFNEELAHPKLKLAKLPRKAALPAPKRNIPSWEVIIEQCVKHPEKYGANLQDLPKKDWEIAKRIYLNVSNMDGRKLKTVEKIVGHAIANYSARWNSTVYTDVASARAMVEFLLTCKIPRHQLLLIHHSRRGQKTEESQNHVQKWIDGVSLERGQVISGEEENKKNMNNRGSVSLIVLSTKSDHNRQRRPRSSSGYLSSIKLLFHLLSDHK